VLPCNGFDVVSLCSHVRRFISCLYCNGLDVVSVCSHVLDYSLSSFIAYSSRLVCRRFIHCGHNMYFNTAELFRHSNVMELKTAEVVQYIIEHARDLNWHVRTSMK
jgi:hypothetical protein